MPTQGEISVADFENAGIDEISGGLAGSLNSQILIDSATYHNLTSGTLAAIGGTITTSSGGNFINDGNIVVNTGSIIINEILSGVGRVALQNGTVELGSAVSQGQAVNFAGPSQLKLDQPVFFAGSINGFTAGDLINLGVAATGISYSANDLKLQVNGSSQTLDLAIAGPYSLSNFTIAASGTTTNITVSGTSSTAPVLNGAGNTVSYASGGAAVAVDPSITISDSDSTLFVGGTVSITNGFFAGDGDTLVANTTGVAVIANYNTATETLILSGTDTIADYQHVLQSIAFGSSIADATGGGAHASRTVSWILNDGSSTSAPVFSTINVQPPCFVAGTRIAVERDEVAVEQLCVGDRVRVVLGSTAMPVVWIGHRHIDCTRHPKPSNVWPVRIAAGALGAGRPHRDLFLSPDHAVYFDGVLIPVKYLINRTTIEQVPVDEVTYYHLELSRHDVLLAEGLPAESYLDTGDRSNFANGDRPLRLYPDFASRVWESASCAPLVVTGPQLDATRRWIDAVPVLADMAQRGSRTVKHAA
jgi:hypothetical protein